MPRGEGWGVGSGCGAACAGLGGPVAATTAARVAPQRAAVRKRRGLGDGANCQRYAYAVLRHFGLSVPPLRSAELWADERATVRAERPRPLDLVLFDGGPAEGRPTGYGAHVGVHLAPALVLHLCKE